MIYYFLLFSRYIDEDIYYPPRSRPLPSIGLHAQQFPEHVTTETETPRKHEVSHHKHAYSNNHVAKEQTLLSARVKRETRAARENRPLFYRLLFYRLLFYRLLFYRLLFYRLFYHKMNQKSQKVAVSTSYIISNTTLTLKQIICQCSKSFKVSLFQQRSTSLSLYFISKSQKMKTKLPIYLFNHDVN